MAIRMSEDALMLHKQRVDSAREELEKTVR